MALPMRMEPSRRCRALSGPAMRIPLIQCVAALAEQPHCEQSGSPPKTQGSTWVLRSAEKFFERRENPHSLGEAGGWSNACA